MRVLHVPVKGIYFFEIKSGEKLEEYRLITPRWKALLEGREYDEIHIKLGYPKKGDSSRVIVRPWRGYTIKTITHPHFGPDPVTVFAIKVN